MPKEETNVFNWKMGELVLKTTHKYLLGFLTAIVIFMFSGITIHAATPSVLYRAYVQDIGWQSWMRDGAVTGTTGRALRLEAIRIGLDSSQYEGGIQYRTYIQDTGWESTWKENGPMSGTTEQNLRLEAIQIRLIGAIADYYDIYYSVYVQNLGWMGWACNGQCSGTSGYDYQIEAIRIKLCSKSNGVNLETSGHYRSHVSINYPNLISLPESLTRIESEAFSGLSQSVRIEVSNNVTYIAKDAFKGSNVVILCPEGSYAESFCVENDVDYLVPSGESNIISSNDLIISS